MVRFTSECVFSRAMTIVLLLMVLVVGACSDGAQEPVEPPLVVRGLIGSRPHRFNEQARAGLQRLGEELGADVRLLQAPDDARRRQLLRQESSLGADLVFCIGEAFEAPIYAEARSYPQTSFVLFPGSPDGDNVAGLEFKLFEAAYLAGALAEVMSGDDYVGIIEGAGGPWLADLEEGFAAGVRSRRYRAEIVHADGIDAPWALAAQGVTVALYASGEADPAVLAAAHDAGVQLVLADPDGLQIDPEVVLGAITLDLAEAMVRIGRDKAEGTFRARTYAFDVGSSVVDLELSPVLRDTAPPELLQLLDAVRAEITAGWVEIEQLGIS